jgi:phospholipase A1
MRHSLFFLCALAFVMPMARADVVLSAPSARVEAGGQLQLVLTFTNESDDPQLVDLPSPLHLELEDDRRVATLDFQPDRDGRIEVKPQGFVRVRLSGMVPVDAEGAVRLKPTGFETNELVIQVDAKALDARVAKAEEGDAARAAMTESRLIDKPPPLSLSVYEPVYFIVGGDGGLNSKFQISFRYRLFDGEGRLARKLPWLDDLYLSFSQTSLWDLNELSKPFKDSSYRPRLFFANYDLGRVLDGRLRLGFEAGVGHESNGKDGDESRSFNMLYLRPVLTLGNPDGLRFYAAPLIHNYIADDENPDLSDYRGYVDWLIGAGSKGGLDFWATLRKGDRSDYGSMEINVSYPLSKLSGGDLNGWIMLQYFNGYGESLLDYSRKLDSQLRLGIAVAL